MSIFGFSSGDVVAAVLGGWLAMGVIRRLLLCIRLAGLPGPWATAVSHVPHSRAMLSGDCHSWYAQISKKYGPVARVAPGVLITSSPEIWAYVNNHPGYKRSDWYYHAARVEYRRDNVFTQTDNDKHTQRRKQMAPGYSGRENQELEPAIDERVREFLALIKDKYISTSGRVVPVDMAKKIQYFTLDVITGVGLGKPFGMLRADADVDGYLSSIEQGLLAANFALAAGVSWMAQAPLVGPYIAPGPHKKDAFGGMMAKCFRFVDERMWEDTGKRSDMLASFARHGLQGDELRSEALEQIIAGSDTTAGAIRGVLLLVMTNPRVCARLQEEIDAAVREGKTTAGEGDVISFAEAKTLPYLQAVIRESLRVRPPVVNIFPRDVPPGGDMVDIGDGKSVFLPEGACIGYSATAMHLNKAVYGQDAAAFRPERWFEPDADKLAAMVRTNELIFGHGKWSCLGKPVAQLELSKVVFEIFRHFDLAPMDAAAPWKAANYLGLFVISDMWVQVMERQDARLE
ncbi:cytochrome P450 71A20 [Plectosphaerella plurivora]|uniref:Cytochrome P450 71A20 n=1 Tax=Plectosphaerella plurivora TaxID=936078 RepID=A0A9P9A5N5_9PEZI|nr:cytochrome P450 71A20 [Plectosphaerella plurivora]